MISTTSLETSKALKLAGFPQDTSFYWDENTRPKKDRTETELDGILIYCGYKNKPLVGKTTYSAPTTDEILVRLPETIKINDIETWWLTIQKCNGIYVCFYECEGTENRGYQENNLLPEALAQMYLWLLKENLLKEK